MKEHALIVFAKVPEPGRVKTRLTPALTEAAAARLYTAFLQDALAQLRRSDADLRLYLAPPARPLPEGLVPDGTAVHWQTGAGLGARMLHAFVETFAAGYERVVVLGTDHPTLPVAFVDQALALLAEPLSVVVGPSRDGGFYLLGMNDLYPQLFEGMTYSHARVFEQTLERARATRAHLAVLPPWYDVDTPEDLRRLAADLDDDSTAGAPHTRAALRALGWSRRGGR